MYLQCTGDSWTKARMRALVRDNFQCQAHKLGLGECSENRLNRLAVHHIKMRINGGTHDLDNLLTVCHFHHAEIHPHLKFQLREEVRELEGFILREL